MPKFSPKSLERLSTCHEDLQVLFNTVIKFFDCTVTDGHRTPEEQYRLFKKGRTEPGQIVTHCDGYNIKSKHNFYPSLAVDVIPYPVDYNDIERIEEFGEFVVLLSEMLQECGKIKHKINWGGKWKPFSDLPHYQIDESNL